MTEAPFISLYRRFRPGRFEELRGQDHVVRALQSAVRDGRVSHAYLFSGPRGTGKTSSARILAKALNCLEPVNGEPCGTCTSCVEIARGTSLDVLELDAASNNGVDSMRELVAHAALGTPGRWKVYIVDEVHMLSNAAANALLKTLEEPPSHVVFVLATTDPQKVPATIRSRTQHLEFRLLNAETLQALVESVRDKAGIDVDEVSLRTVVRRGRGSARDALSALDQIVASGADDGIRPELSSVESAIGEGAANDVLVGLSTLLAEGWGPQQLATELVDDLRQTFLSALAPELCAASGPELDTFAKLADRMGLPRIVRSMEILGCAMVDMRDAPDAQVVLEIALVRATRPDLDQGTAALAERLGVLEHIVGTGRPVAHQPEIAEVPTKEALTESTEIARRLSVGAVQRRKAESPGAGGKVDIISEEATVVSSEISGPSAPEKFSSSALDRESFTQAWGDGLLQSLSARAKALYSAGRFVSVGDEGVKFALPNAAHRDRCSELVPQVEAMLSAHFAAPITLILVVDGVQGDVLLSHQTKTTEVPSVPHEKEADDEDPSEFDASFESSHDQPASAVERLLEVFPGAEEIHD